MFLTLKITVFCNLVFFKTCKYFYSLSSFTAYECLLSSIILDTQPLTLINGNSVSGMTWELPKKFYIRCVFAFHGAFPPIASPPKGRVTFFPPAGQLRHRSILLGEEEFVKGLERWELSPQHREHWAIPACSNYFS